MMIQLEGLYLILCSVDIVVSALHNPAKAAGCTMLPIWPLFAGIQHLKNTKWWDWYEKGENEQPAGLEKMNTTVILNSQKATHQLY